MIDCDVVIIDSGLEPNIEPDGAGICVKKTDNGYVYTEDIADSIGHGTIIYSVIKKQAPAADIFMIKVDGCMNDCDSTLLVAALNYVRNNIKCRIVNISLGVKICENIIELYEICSEISNSGVLIVSAFDNEGCHSYPATFDCVIGVDSKSDFKCVTEYDYVENSPINVFAKGSIQRLSLQDGRLLLVGGASISCAHIVSVLVNELNGALSMENALSYLKTRARKIYIPKKTDDIVTGKLFKISNAIVFPFAKEQHAFVRFPEMLPFKIKGYYDVRQSGKVGRKLSSYYEKASDDETIMDIDKVDLEGIDTIILGHLDELNAVFHHDYRAELINKAIENKVNIYSFDPLEQYLDMLNLSDIDFFYPRITSKEVPNNSFGKLYKISKPVVGIFGTASQQGKFSLQLTLKKELESREYNVGTIGTEPHSLLFGFDIVFPMGYNSTVDVQNQEVVQYLNYAMNGLCLGGKEIILAASQAQTIPFYCNNLLEFPPLQYHFALGLKPDAIVMCINYFDEMDYIRNSVYTLKGLTDATLIAFVMYPMTYSNDWSNVKRKVTYEEFNEKSEALQGLFNVPVYLLGEKFEGDLCQKIIDYF